MTRFDDVAYSIKSRFDTIDFVVTANFRIRFLTHKGWSESELRGLGNLLCQLIALSVQAKKLFSSKRD